MKSHFKFNKQERNGIFFLLAIIIILQGTYFFVKAKPFASEGKIQVDMAMQSQLDSLRLLAMEESPSKIFPFNPNYITDYKGYTLGMSTDELDRLFAYRKAGKFVNSAQEFQKVTQVSDSLLKTIEPFFRFPDWIQTKKKKTDTKPTTKQAFAVRDLNKATADELRVIYGIGEKLSERIIKFRDRLGGFLVNEQLYDVYGLEPEVAQRVFKKFKVQSPPSVKKININLATAKEIASLVYISRSVADGIVAYRNEVGKIDSFEKLFNVNEFPINKIDRIKLYLSL